MTPDEMRKIALAFRPSTEPLHHVWAALADLADRLEALENLTNGMQAYLIEQGMRDD